MRKDEGVVGFCCLHCKKDFAISEAVKRTGMSVERIVEERPKCPACGGKWFVPEVGKVEKESQVEIAWDD